MKTTITICCLLLGTGLNGQWEQYFSQYDGVPGSVLVDMSYHELAPLEHFSYVVSTGVQFEQCNKDGLPESLIYEDLVRLSDKLEEYLAIQLTSRLVGTFTHQCKRVDFYYVKDTVGIRSFLTNFYEKNGVDYQAIISTSYDPDWDMYKAFLYPDSYILEYMMNSKVIQQLVENGDDIKRARRVDHWAYFSTDLDRDQYRLLVLERGFKVEDQGYYRGEELPYFIKFSRRDKLKIDYITELTEILQTKAMELRGAYDGWESEVVAKN